MSRMIRKQIYIEPRQEDMLKRRAKELGISEAELIRRCLDQVDCDADRARRIAAWEEEKKYIRENRMMDVPQTGRTWTREQIYEEMEEERFGRHFPRHEHPDLPV